MNVYYANPKTGIVVKNGVAISIDMLQPYHVSFFINPADIKHTLQFRAEELNPKDKRYKEVVEKCKELSDLLKIEE